MQITIDNISKTFGKKTALDQVSLEINKGMFGLIGHNGAGKTTLMRIISTLQRPDKGHVYIEGKDITKHITYAKDNIGFLPQDFNFYPQLTAKETLDYLGRLNGLIDKFERQKQVDNLLNRVNLITAGKTPVGGFSGGMKRRLGIAAAMIKDPNIIIVDEPTAGLDPEERVRFRTMLVELSENKIVILSTHIVEDISASCHKIALLDHGQIAYTGSPTNWLKTVENKVWEVHTKRREDLLHIRDTYQLVSIKETSSGTHLRCIADQVEGNFAARRVEPNLEDAYLHYNTYGK